MSDRVEALRAALAAGSDNPALRLVLAETLATEGRRAEALDEYDRLARDRALDGRAAAAAAQLALDLGRFDQTQRLLDAAGAEGADVQAALDRIRGLKETEGDDSDDEPTHGGLPSAVSPLGEHETCRFDDVGGLVDVKKAITRAVILPYQRPDLYLTYGRGGGGGVLLYGPPGCGKTMLARATAGECGLPFQNVRIEQVLSPYIGASEQNLHQAFEAARASAPCVLFLDEIDAIGFARRKHHGSAARPLVDQLLQELDAIGSDNRDLLVLAATNAPWDVDEALKRPGRFDKLQFIPPPDEEARRRILDLLLKGRPVDGVDVEALARATPLFSGADLRSLVEHAIDEVIEEALETGGSPPLTGRHLERARQAVRPSTIEWLATARNYVEFSNEGGRYDDVRAFLRSGEGRRAR